ncbi:hypothetical protein [Cryobacterium sp. Hb1]|uniref:hypothetical protein n=1 Tax=Cryobacterium sp. Hb1 TaxID=1259147 RepID=UPI001069D8DA|nr:hypothetical protein [Cryobacterium sp. Hb1]TFD70105.1 hypothetical protein E3T38_06675 [Cryobacterium sp. Hb1]
MTENHHALQSMNRSRARKIDQLICILLALASLGLVLWQVPKHTTVSPADEYVYIDYLAKVPDQIVVHRGEEVGAYARSYLACNGVRLLGGYPADMCITPPLDDDPRLPNSGMTSADLYTPLYFTATRAMAQPLVSLGVADLVEAGRISGWTWLAAAAILLYLSLRRWKVPVAVASGVSLLMVGSLPAYWSNTYVSTDATGLLSGALMLFAATLVIERRKFGALLFVMSAVALPLLKLQNLIAVGVAALLLLIVAGVNAYQANSGTRSRTSGFLKDGWTRMAIAAIVGAVVAQCIWVIIRAVIAIGPAPDQGISTPITVKALISEFFKFIPELGNGAVNPNTFGFGEWLAAALMTWAIVGGIFGLLLAAEKGSHAEAIAIASLTVAVLAGPILAVVLVTINGFYFTLPPRYGISLLPFCMACLALLFARKTWLGYFIPVVGVVSYVSILSITG